MGLDTSHDCWHGPYGSFGRWRNTLAKAAGYRIVRDEHTVFQLEFAQLDWDLFTHANGNGDWTSEPDDPLLYLLVHSDCDGVIRPEQGRPLADRLEELVPLLADEWDVSLTRQFIAGLREAAEAGEDVDFH